MFIRSRKPSNASFIEVLETKQQTKKVERATIRETHTQDCWIDYNVFRENFLLNINYSVQPKVLVLMNSLVMMMLLYSNRPVLKKHLKTLYLV